MPAVRADCHATTVSRLQHLDKFHRNSAVAGFIGCFNYGKLRVTGWVQGVMGTTVQVIIVNWNGGDHLVRCLDSFGAVASDRVAVESVTVVDNASADGSIDRAEAFTDRLPLRIIRNPDNRGFAAACNQAASGSSADFLLFLNPDTELRPGCLKAPAQFLVDPANAGFGIVGIKLVDALGRNARTCSRHPSLASLIGGSLGLDHVLPSMFPPHFLPEHAHEGIRQVDQVMGAFFFVRRALFERLGGFDERFFLYFEDADFALRARNRGFSSGFLSTVSAVHTGHGSSGKVKARRLFYFGRSRIRFGAKHFGLAGGLAVSTATLILEPVLRAGRAVVGGQFAELRDVARGSVLLWANLPGILHHRRA
jgi:N-acetylglucosaminyl-diphospho-decaprenol L-rhamnosyltransferase